MDERRPRRYQRHGIRHKSLTVSLSETLWRDVREHAARRGFSTSDVVARAIALYLQLAANVDDEKVA